MKTQRPRLILGLCVVACLAGLAGLTTIVKAESQGFDDNGAALYSVQ